MKQIIVLFMILATSTSVLAQTPLVAGDNCFGTGDYVCAQLKYQEAMKIATGRDKQIAEIKYSRAKSCDDWLTAANIAFNNGDYQTAKENYQSVLNENLNDPYAQTQLEKCNNAIRDGIKLSVSRENMTFSRIGGNETIIVTTNAESYSISQIPSWCTVRKYSDYFVIYYSANSDITTRNGSFKITADNKEVDLYVTQPKKSNTTLSVSPKEIFTNANESVAIINVNTNSSDYKITDLPYWCRVKSKHASWFSLEYNTNYSRSLRSGRFKVIAGDKEIKIYVNQSASTQSSTSTVKNEKKKRIKRRLRKFSSLGFQSGEIAKYGLLYETGGRKTFGFRLSVRTSQTPKEIFDTEFLGNKTEMELGPNIKILQRLYLNLGGGYGFYKKIISIDNEGAILIQDTGCFVGTTGLMIRVSPLLNINVGLSFQDIDKDFYDPEITFGISFNLRKKTRY
jgi:hypothetical protein